MHLPRFGKAPRPLIIRAELVNPPTWFASFRDLTLYCSIFLKVDVLLESNDIDTYYRWIKPRGGMDFVQQFIRPGEEDGLRLDIEAIYAPTIITDRIAPENVHRLISSIRSARG